MTERARDSNLDLLRALAIIAVVVYHVAGMWPTKYAVLEPVIGLGKYGVTLFFVLSGWLIGGIYWREHRTTGRVRLGHFWTRRWLRTVPPYWVGMALGYLAVMYSRNEQFDYRYLFFMQNYEAEMPYYLISWSLCVEEHFYLVLPFIGAICARIPPSFAATGIWGLAVLPPLLRVIDPGVHPQDTFGYSHTATHLVSEGLALGVAAAFTRCYYPDRWSLLQRYAAYLALPALGVFLTIAWWDKQSVYWVGQSVVALCCLVWLAAYAGRKPLNFASSRIIYCVALTSYSVYLTHSMAIHIARRLVHPTGSLFLDVGTLVGWLAIVATAGGLFYFIVERTSIQLRDYVSRLMNARRAALANEPA